MANINKQVYPACPTIIRNINIGGLTKSQLIQALQDSTIFINKYGEMLLADDRFIVSSNKYNLKTVEIAVSNLGLPNGATTPEILHKATELGLHICPLELGPYLRLSYLDQPEDATNTSKVHQVPTGSITVASEPLTEDDEFPKGFYLRKIDGKLWLRGYIADNFHIWNADDRFIFVLSKEVDDHS
ncbi:helicase [Niallia taxi]|uniref:helicase n=1 Tax=Niallia taxi TaxID=2499688 RepID=UPI003D2B0D41